MNKTELIERSKEVWRSIRSVDVAMRAASVSYYAMLASIPLLAIILTFSARLLPDLSMAGSTGAGDLTAHELNQALARLLPNEATSIIKQEIARIQSEPPVGLLSIGLLLTLWTASNAYSAMITAMNEIYGVRESRPFWKLRLYTLFMPVVFAVIIILALVGIVAAPSIINALHLDQFAGRLIGAAQWLVIYGLIILSFDLAYRMGPCSLKHAKRVTTGSIVGATIFMASSLLFQLYVQHFGSYDKVYGSLGGAIMFLVWIWVLSTCLLIGCAVNKVLEDDCTRRRQSLDRVLPPETPSRSR